MARKLMNAFIFGDYVGGHVGLKEVKVKVPTPGKNEVLIKVEAASLNPVDWKSYSLKALLGPILARGSPLIPATDVAGEVVEVGSAVHKFKPGEKVVSNLGFIAGGGLSEYAVAKETLTVLRPPEVSAVQGAGLPIAGMTAHLALTQYAGLSLDGTGPRKNILVTAASGGVGHYTVQLAKLGKHHVTATCGERNINLVKSLGADEVLDYKSREGKALRSPSSVKYDAVVHCSASPAIPWSVFESNLSENGIVVDMTPGPAAMYTFVVKKLTFSKKRLVPLMLSPSDDRALKFLVETVKLGGLKTVVDSTHSFNEAEEAWRRGIDGHATGKIIVEL